MCRGVNPSSLLLEDQETAPLQRELLPRLVDREPDSSLSVLSVKVRVSFRSRSLTYTHTYMPPATVHTLAYTGRHTLHTHIHTYTQSLEFSVVVFWSSKFRKV